MKNFDPNKYIFGYEYDFTKLKKGLSDNGITSEYAKASINETVKRQIFEGILWDMLDKYPETIDIEKNSVRMEFYMIPKKMFDDYVKKIVRNY